MTLPDLLELILFGFLTVPLGLLLKGWLQPAARRPDTPSWLWRGAWCLAATGSVWLAVRFLTALGHVDARLWTAPFERLLAAATLVGLGWSAGVQGQRWWRLGLAASFALALVAYLDLAPLWAQEILRGQGQPGTLLIQGWDYGLFLLGLFVLQALWRNGASAPLPIRLAVAAIGLGNFLQIVASRNLTMSFAPSWARLGLLAAAACFLAAAVSEDLIAGVARFWRGSRRRAPGEQPRQASAPRLVTVVNGSRSTSQGESGGPAEWPWAPWTGASPLAAQALPDPEVELGPELAAAEALRTLIAELGTHAAIVGLITDGGRFELWHAAPSRPPRLVGRYPMAELPTLARAMSVGNLRFDGAILASDLIKLYVLIGSASLPTLVQVIAGHGQRYGVIVAGRPGPWPPRDAATIERIANVAALRLAAIEVEVNQRDQLGRVLSELETQAHVLGRLASTVEDLGAHLELLRQGAVPPTVPAPPSPPIEYLGPAVAVEPQPTAPVAADFPTLQVVTEMQLPGAIALGEERLRGTTVGLPLAGGVRETAPPLPSTASSGPTNSGLLDSRLALFEQALAKLPWGVMVVDADNAVAMANPAVTRLLHTAERPVGQSVLSALPEGERVDYALHRLKQTARTSSLDAPIEVLVESPAARLSIEGLVDPVMGYLGALVVASSSTEPANSPLAEFIPLLTDALEQPIRSILGYREIWSKMSYSDDPYTVTCRRSTRTWRG